MIRAAENEDRRDEVAPGADGGDEAQPTGGVDGVGVELRGDIVRLEAKTDAGFERLDGKMDKGFERLDGKMDKGFERLDNKIDGGLGRLDTKIDRLDSKIDHWMIAVVVGVLGLLATNIGIPGL